ncbi:MAG: ABC transporter permease [Acidobacteria bacterium]|nr:ABC transporter permease [Acidobacteriota bacterium]
MLLLDFRYALRTLGRQKAFTTAVVLTLALGIGATTAIFTVVSALVLRPLPFARPDQLVQVSITTPLVPEGGGVDMTTLAAFRSGSRSFEAFASYEVSARYLRGPEGFDGFERVMAVSGDRSLFSVLGVPPIAGRTFALDDPLSVVVVSQHFLNERLGGNLQVVGSALTLDGEPFTVIGVMAESFQFPYAAGSLLRGVATESRTDLWIPHAPARGRPSVVGRLKSESTIGTAERELDVIVKRNEAAVPEANRGRGVRLVPLSDVVVAGSVRRPLFFLFGAVAIVLALACANVMNLSLVRTTLRRREIAVRTALGANPGSLARLFLVESLLLSFAGGLAGLVLAKVGTDRLIQMAAPYVPRAAEVGLDWRVFVFLLVTCAIAASAFGLVTAVLARRTDPAATIRDGGDAHSTIGLAPRRLRDGLVVVEIALAFMLAVGGALLVRELLRLRQTDPGMSTRNVVTFHLGHRRTPATGTRQFYEIAERVAQLPGVRAAGFTQMVPLQNWGWTSSSTDFRIRGRASPPPPPYQIELRYVTPGYFQALGIPIRRGRSFEARDDQNAPPVIIINETLTRRSFGADDPIGNLTTRGTVIGVAGDVRSVHLDRPAVPEIYYPIAQNWSQISDLGMSLIVGARARPDASIIDRVRQVVRDVNPNLAVFNIRTMDRVVADSLSGFTLYLWLMTGFAGLALVLALTGTYGVVSYVAASRAREFAIRIALGATAERVAGLVIGRGMLLAILGLAGGWFGAVAATPLLRNLPVAVRPPDLATTLLTAAFISIVAFAACWIPARRAARVEPMSGLRDDR